MLKRAVVALASLLLVAGCASPAPKTVFRATEAPPSTRTVLPVFYATDQLPSDVPRDTAAFLAAPFTHRIFLDRANPVTLGRVTGSIARTPASLGRCEPGWWRQEQIAAKTKPRFPLSAVEMLQGDAFYSELKTELTRLAKPDAAPPCEGANPLTRPGRRVLLYIHGFNNSFGVAAGNAAQFVYDLDIRAAPVIFSWPTQESLLKYTRDETYAERAAPLLKELIAGIVDKTAPDELYIIAHSMGARITLQALQELSTERSGRFVPAEALVLYAPDIDTLLFERVYMDQLLRFARRTTVYSNTHDIPLSVSRRINGGYALGDFDGAPFTGKTFRMIDIGAARQSRLNHGGFEDSPIIIQQIQHDLLGVAPDQRPCLCRTASAGVAARNPPGTGEPYYRLALDQPHCPFPDSLYRPRKQIPPCAE